MISSNVSQQIRQRIELLPNGEPFTPSAFMGCGPRASIDQALTRLTKAGLIERVSRGIYVRPEVSRFVGRVMPEPMQVAQTLAKSSGSLVQVHGAEAALRLELTTQVPTQPIYITSGRSRRVQVGQMEIRLQHVSRRKLALAGRPAGLALSAMWYLGKTEVTPSLVEKIRQKLGSSEFDALKAATSSMPAWMSDAVYRCEQVKSHA
jgi:predicted transcriptional regulator of viral defense system